MCSVVSVRRRGADPLRRSARTANPKLTLKEQFRYWSNLSRLYDFHYPHASPIAKF